jgi:hypothetical protein
MFLSGKDVPMSLDATRWAWLQSGIKPTAKFVLLSMADRAGEDYECYPSIKRLCDDTNLDRKTVIRSLKFLCDCRLIADTGKRKGSTGQVVVYRLIGVESRSQFGEFEDANDTKRGTVPKVEQFPFSDERVPFFPNNSTVFPIKESQKRDTESINNLPKNQSNNLSSTYTKKSVPKTKKKQPVKTTIPDDFAVSAGVLSWYREKRYAEDINKHLESFKDKCKAKGYKYIDFDSAFKGAIRDDWAALRKNINLNGGKNGTHGISEEQWWSTDF